MVSEHSPKLSAHPRKASLDLRNIFLENEFIDMFDRFSQLHSDKNERLDIRVLLDCCGQFGIQEGLKIVLDLLKKNYVRAVVSEVSLNDSTITKLPDLFSSFFHEPLELLKLSLTENCLVELPDDCLNKFPNLVHLQIDENRLTKLPDNFGANWTSLTLLDLEFNRLQSLPESFSGLTALEILSLSNNCLEVIPEWFGLKLEKLQVLDLGKNRIHQMPSNMVCSRTLQRIYLNDNLLNSLANWINECPNLVELNFSDNPLHGVVFTESFCKTSSDNCRYMTVSSCHLDELPDNIGLLKNLMVLHCGSSLPEIERLRQFNNGNCFNEIPVSIKHCSSLTKLRLDENEIYEFPEGIAEHLISLEDLDLSHNMLTSLPDDFGCFPALKNLKLAMNLLTELPASFVKLEHLELLRLDENKLTGFPEGMERLRNLKNLNIAVNQIEEAPPFIEVIRPQLVVLSAIDNPFCYAIQDSTNNGEVGDYSINRLNQRHKNDRSEEKWPKVENVQTWNGDFDPNGAGCDIYDDSAAWGGAGNLPEFDDVEPVPVAIDDGAAGCGRIQFADNDPWLDMPDKFCPSNAHKDSSIFEFFRIRKAIERDEERDRNVPNAAKFRPAPGQFEAAD